VSIVQQKPVILIARKDFPQLLQGPLRGRVFGDIEVKQASGSELKGNEYIKDPEAYRRGNEAVASDKCHVHGSGGTSTSADPFCHDGAAFAQCIF
jgi:hypothetical protein